MSTRRNQKMIYISDENLAFYEAMKDKSDFINKKIKELKDEGKEEKELSDFEKRIQSVRQMTVDEAIDGRN